MKITSQTIKVSLIAAALFILAMVSINAWVTGVKVYADYQVAYAVRQEAAKQAFSGTVQRFLDRKLFRTLDENKKVSGADMTVLMAPMAVFMFEVALIAMIWGRVNDLTIAPSADGAKA